MNCSSLGDDNFEFVQDRIWMLTGSLKGISALLQQQSNDACFNREELHGLGQLFEVLSRVEAILCKI